MACFYNQSKTLLFLNVVNDAGYLVQREDSPPLHCQVVSGEVAVQN
jgi:hypothetical protein